MKFDGKKLLREMRKREVGYETLARVLRWEGAKKCSRQNVHAWCRGRQSPDFEMTLALCKVFECSPEFFEKKAGGISPPASNEGLTPPKKED